MNRTVIKNGFVVSPEWIRKADVLIEGAKIIRVARDIDTSGAEVIDASGRYILPGLIDAHTHYHLVSRGTVTADSFYEGSRLAAYGGVTTVVDFADDDNKGHLSLCTAGRVGEMEKRMAVDFALHQGVYSYRDTLEEEMEMLKNRGVKVLKMFTTYKNVGYMVDNPDELKEVFRIAKKLGMMISVHCEDDRMIQQIDSTYTGEYNPAAHACLRPASVEAAGIETVGRIALELDMPLYVVHLSSRKGLETVRELRSLGARIIVETTPTYLFLERSMLSTPSGSLYVMTPPLRDKEDNRALQEALMGGEIQNVASDHCTFTREQKLASSDCRTIYPGVPGTEEILPLLHTLITDRGGDLRQLVSLCSANPATSFGLYPRKGAVRSGSDADLVIFDPEVEWTLSSSTTHSASGYTAYEGTKVRGRAETVLLRGRKVISGGKWLGSPGTGRFLSQKSVAQLR